MAATSTPSCRTGSDTAGAGKAPRSISEAGDGGALVLDDTGFPNQGADSVGVARQYSGTLCTIGNCQEAVTLQYVTERAVIGVDAQRYLPGEWTEDPERLRKASVPRQIGFRPKWQIAFEILQRARDNGFRGPVLADSAYGDVTEFRDELQVEGWAYALGVSSTLKVVAADHDFGEVPTWRDKGRRPSRPAKVRARACSDSVKEWSQSGRKDFRKVTWREGSKGKLCSRFASWRVRPAHRLSAGQEPRGECWLLAEWPEGEAAPTKFFFSNLPATTSPRRLVACTKGRWWVEHSYKEMKDELGLDHFEGRNWLGWHHQVSLVLVA